MLVGGMAVAGKEEESELLEQQMDFSIIAQTFSCLSVLNMVRRPTCTVQITKNKIKSILHKIPYTLGLVYFSL